MITIMYMSQLKAASNRSLINRARTIWDTLFKKRNSQRELQELNDLYKLLIACKYHNLRLNKRQQPDTAVNPTNLQINDNDLSSNSLLFEQAFEYLDKDLKVHEMSNKMLRRELQHLLDPQIISLFQSFQNVDSHLFHEKIIKPHPQHDIEIDDHTSKYANLDPILDLSMCSDILSKEYHYLLQQIVQLKQYDESPNQLYFLTQKKKAILTLSSFYKWNNFFDQHQCQHSSSYPIDPHVRLPTNPDPFGYTPNTSHQSNSNLLKRIRLHQCINLIKSTLLRQSRLGFSVLSLQSSIHHVNAGRGLFVDGYAAAGSLLAFFPGYVWPKEHLTNSTTDSSTSTSISSTNSVSQIFSQDPNYHLSLRYDDILIDSRKAPYTLLHNDISRNDASNTHSNPFAIAHIANHPPEGVLPNAATTMINFTNQLKFSDNKLLQKYIPNIYARSPMMLGPSSVDIDTVLMHGFGLVASRDLCNEEVLYDYRLSPALDTDYPDWYHICNQEELNNRWSQS